MTTLVQKKVCLLGDFAVGKTSLVRRFIEGRFDDKYLGTIGVKISRKTIARSYGQLNLLIWDMTGGEDLESRARMSYLHGAAGALMVCDLTRDYTLEVFENYVRQMRTLNPQVSLMFLANKVDLVNQRAISDEELWSTTKALGGLSFCLTSAKTGENVESAFLQLADMIEEKS
jgi:small GTP-binding protein